MTDQGLPPIETSGGYRPPASVGERMLIGLVMVALFGGLLVGIGNLLGAEDGVANASPSGSAAATSTARPTHRPRVTPTPFPETPPVVALDPGEPEPFQDGPRDFYGWIRVTGDLQVHAAAHATASILREAHAGDVLFGYQAFVGWLELATSGFVRSEDPAIQLVEQQTGPSGGELTVLAAGPDGFLAIGFRQSSTSPALEILVAVTADGQRWESELYADTGWDLDTVAFGPAGWLAVSPDYTTDGRLWVRASADGLSWSWLGSLSLPSSSYPAQLVASDDGYLLSVWRYGGTNSRYSVLYSKDGRQWEERPEPGGTRLVLRDDRPMRIAGAPGGFVLWTEGGAWTGPRFSTDAITWTDAIGPNGGRVLIAPLGAALRAFDEGPDGTTRAWTGTVTGNRVSWRVEEVGASLANASILSLSGSPRLAVASGFDTTTGQARAWINRGEGWVPTRLPSGYHGFGAQSVAGPTGALLIGYRPSLRGDNPLIWHLTADGWRPEAEPFLPIAEDPARSECGPPPADAIDLWAMERARGPACFAGRDITIRAWSAACDGCYGGPSGHFEKEWLANPTVQQLFLSPVEAADGNWANAVLHPSVRLDAAWRNAWVEVTGHFDDPAAQRCRYVPDREDLGWYPSTPSLVISCREQFVVTAVTVVDAP